MDKISVLLLAIAALSQQVQEVLAAYPDAETALKAAKQEGIDEAKAQMTVPVGNGEASTPATQDEKDQKIAELGAQVQDLQAQMNELKLSIDMSIENAKKEAVEAFKVQAHQKYLEAQSAETSAEMDYESFIKPAQV